ncbi:MAG TPA: hypothetical protein VGF29_04560 [Hyphomicrobiaceae bacterium]|jgi:hypothetical protein
MKPHEHIILEIARERERQMADGDPKPPRHSTPWPGDLAWWKPKDRRQGLIAAAALIVAEIERLDTIAAPQTSSPAADTAGRSPPASPPRHGRG